MARWQRVASALLVQISIPLAMYSGALLWLSARLAWDPSTYVWLRLVAPRELEAAARLLPAAAAALAALPHLAAAAVSPLPPAPRRYSRLVRRLMLLLYILICSGVLGGAAALGAWAARRAGGWRAAAARAAEDARLLADHGRAMLGVLAHHHPLPQQINELIDEAMADLPKLAYSAGGAAALLLLLLAAGAALAAALALYFPPKMHHNDVESLSAEEQPLQPAHLTLKRG